MKRRQEDKGSMLLRVKKRLTEAEAATIAAMPGAAALIVEFLTELDILNENGADQTRELDGYAVVKAKLKVVMVGKTVDICRRAQSYAVNSDLPVLFNEMSWRRSTLIKEADTRCGDICQEIYELALPLAAELLIYGVTAAKLTELEASIAAFVSYIPEPRLHIEDRMAATQGIADAFSAIDVILGKMDVFVDMLETSHPAFFYLYFASRKIINTGSRTLALRGFVCDAAGVGMGGVKIYIEGVKKVKKSSALGNFQMRHLKEGVYKIICRKNGFVDVVLDVAVTGGERSEVRVVMEAVVLELF